MANMPTDTGPFATPPTNKLGLLRSQLAAGSPLDNDTWQRRHQIVLGSLVANALVVGVRTLANSGNYTLGMSATAVITTFAVLATFLPHPRARSTAAIAGLLSASTLAVVVTDGATETQILFIAGLVVASLYRDWLVVPMGIIWALVDLIAVVSYAPNDEWWRWALIRAITIGTITVSVWANETSQLAITHLQRRSQLILDSAAEGIIGLARNGELLFANPAAKWLLGIESKLPDRLTGPDGTGCVTGHVNPDGTVTNEPCPICDTLIDGTARRVATATFWRTDGTPIPVSYTVTALTEGDRNNGAVICFGDRTAEVAAAEWRADAETQRQIVTQLAEILQPPKTTIENTDYHVIYLPAADAPTGGDLYDIATLADGTIHIAVVDVAGKGLRATRDAVVIINALRVLAREGVNVEDLVKRADELIGNNDGTNPIVATVGVARWHPTTGQVTVATGGHPWPIIARADGTSETIRTRGGAIGMPHAGSRNSATVHLHEGDALIMYTDGLIEARRNTLAGLQQAEQVAASIAGHPATKIAEELVTQATDGVDGGDDTCVVVVRRLGPDDTTDTEVIAAVDGPTARRARTRIVDHATADGYDTELTRIGVATSEAIANAIGASPGEPVQVRYSSNNDRIQVTVTNRTREPFQLPERTSLPEATSTSGRGLYLMERLADELVHTSIQDSDGLHRNQVTVTFNRPNQPYNNTDSDAGSDNDSTDSTDHTDSL